MVGGLIFWGILSNAHAGTVCDKIEIIPGLVMFLHFWSADPGPYNTVMLTATEIKSIQLHDSIVMALPWDCISYIYIYKNQSKLYIWYTNLVLNTDER